MSLGAFGLFLTGLLVVACRARRTRIRTVFTAVVALLLGMVIAGSDGMLNEPSHRLVDGVRAGVGSVARSAVRAASGAVERAVHDRVADRQAEAAKEPAMKGSGGAAPRR